LGGNLLEFVTCFSTWILAQRLQLSPVLCLVAFAMTVARKAGLTQPPRMRVHSFAVWESVVFLLNVLAFLLMGLQARTILGSMAPDRLHEAAGFAGLVIGCVIAVRLLWVLAFNRLSWRFPAFRGNLEPPTLRQGVLVGWCGMRGLVTLATAFALPADFPQRDLIVLTAFAVVLATLVLQGLTLVPLVRLLQLDREDGLDRELAAARADLAQVALATLKDKEGPAAGHWRYSYEAALEAAETGNSAKAEEKKKLGLTALRHQRKRLQMLRATQKIGPDAYLTLQEELDFRELALATEAERHIEET
jgi:CPA1 family monovalent cation:H+ antiporter